MPRPGTGPDMVSRPAAAQHDAGGPGFEGGQPRPAWPGPVAHPFDPPPGAKALAAPWPDAPSPRAGREPRATPVDAHVGTRVRQARTLRGMSQGALGEALGITFQQVQRYEQGVNRIGASRLFDLAHALDMPIAFFFDGVGGEATNLSSPPTSTPPHRPHRLAPGAPERTETLDLIRTFDRIVDPAVRRQVLSLVKTIAPGDG